MNQSPRRSPLWHIAFAVVVAAVGTSAGGALAADTSSLLACQKGIERDLQGIATSIPANRLYRCVDFADRCELAFELDAVDPTACRIKAATGCSLAASRLNDPIKGAKVKSKTRIVARCGSLPFDDVKAFVSGLGFFNVANDCPPAGVANMVDLADCLVESTQCHHERQVYRGNPRAQDALIQADAADDFPCVAP